jgi:hypothetical protein
MVQVPAAIKDALVPDTVHTAVESDTKDTASPELAVADSVKVAPTDCVAIELKVMVCDLSAAAATVNFCVTLGAAA